MQGLVLGKFMPLHKGHIALIEFAASQCDKLIVLVCHDPYVQTMDGNKRYEWMVDTFRGRSNIQVEYISDHMPDSTESSREVSKVWSTYLKNRFPQVNVLFSSEDYGQYVAEYMGIENRVFNKERTVVPISATMIRNNPMKYWDMIADAAKPFFAKKVCIYGPESCGKSTLTKFLAEHFNTNYVPEMARELLTENGVERHCEQRDMYPIGILHANTINERIKQSNRILFVDSDIITTQIYSATYYGNVPTWPQWVMDTNQYDLYLLATPEVPWVNDGTRDLGHIRQEMYRKFKKGLEDRNIPYTLISGNSYEDRNSQAIAAVSSLLKR